MVIVAASNIRLRSSLKALAFEDTSPEVDMTALNTNKTKSYTAPPPTAVRVPDLKGEHWRPIPGANDTYMVSDMARVKSLGRWCPIRGGSKRWHQERLCQTHFPSGIFAVFLAKGVGHCRRLAPLVLTTFIGRPKADESRKIVYANGDNTDCRLANMSWKKRTWLKVADGPWYKVPPEPSPRGDVKKSRKHREALMR
jgi:hypothetical protein